ncbi:MAG: hypothetical protein FWE40_05450 [Oscillospiraceae bacterium]|jgi:hypothetical protein|nr:hypothetical protein [Oscillospiraceae bacterium]
MLRNYLNQTAKLERQNGIDDRGQSTYHIAKIIRCRKEKRMRLQVAGYSSTLKPGTVYYITIPVVEGDKLDGVVVLAVDEWVGLKGNVQGYEAVV